jgi:hypothetical protein
MGGKAKTTGTRLLITLHFHRFRKESDRLFFFFQPNKNNQQTKKKVMTRRRDVPASMITNTKIGSSGGVTTTCQPLHRAGA